MRHVAARRKFSRKEHSPRDHTRFARGTWRASACVRGHHLLALALATLFTMPAVDCGVVADTAVRAENEKERRRRIRLLRNVDGVVEIVYAGTPLRAPIDGEAIGVRIAQSGSDVESGGSFVQLVVDDGTDARCAPFLARVDDSLRNDLVVLGIVKDGALLARGDALFFARAPTTREPPTFRLAWQSSFILSAPTPSPSAKPPRAAAKQRR